MDTELQCQGTPPQMSLIPGPSLFKNLPIRSMISALLFSSVVKGGWKSETLIHQDLCTETSHAGTINYPLNPLSVSLHCSRLPLKPLREAVGLPACQCG